MIIDAGPSANPKITQSMIPICLLKLQFKTTYFAVHSYQSTWYINLRTTHLSYCRKSTNKNRYATTNKAISPIIIPRPPLESFEEGGLFTTAVIYFTP